MKIINIGILAHVDAGKTTLTESLLQRPFQNRGASKKGQHTMFLDTAPFKPLPSSGCFWDTPGHMDFLAEVPLFGCFRWGHLGDLR